MNVKQKFNCLEDLFSVGKKCIAHDFFLTIKNSIKNELFHFTLFQAWPQKLTTIVHDASLMALFIFLCKFTWFIYDTNFLQLNEQFTFSHLIKINAKDGWKQLFNASYLRITFNSMSKMSKTTCTDHFTVVTTNC